ARCAHRARGRVVVHRGDDEPGGRIAQQHRVGLPHGRSGRPASVPHRGERRRGRSARVTTVGLWTLGLALAYTVWLVVGGRWVVARQERGANFFVSGRTFSPWTVAFCITGLFSGSSYIAIVELSYRTGISAIWYGVAETVQIILIAVLLVKPLRRKLVVTVTGIIGDRFGRAAQAVSAVITGFTFPMYSLATAIAFASALTVITDVSLWQSITLTAVVLF